jgi:prefoldin alpha subunit
LIPIGGNSFLFAKALAPDTAIVGIGADLAVETSMEEALIKMDERINEIEEAMKSLNERYKVVADKAAELTAKIQSAYEGK